ncbi:hypothetical protein EDC01DRAFT_615463 [Geopyxis carbonaria]|nr:hypothetical protein EDC01DRAFT_615463 [Geopyxis carbonaria]
MFSPPPQTGSAMSNPHGGPNGPFNPFSPISIPHGTPGPAAMPSPIGAAPNHAFAFHLPRQSVSMTGTPDLNGYDNPYGVYPPPGPPQHTHSPSMAGSGIWSPPYGGMRNGSPGMMGMGMHGHSASQFNAGYPPEPLMDPYAPHHGLVGQERYHQHQIRRGSPLAHVNHNIYAIQDEVVSHDGPAIDAPVPKHRHQLSVTLQKEFDNSENYQSDGSRNVANGHPLKPEDDEAFATNPVSPAPAHYPEQPEMPNVETDVHNGPELTSDPEDDISNDKVEKQKNIQQAHDRQKSLEFISAPYNTDQNVQLQMPDIQPDFQQYMPHTQYALPHSREQSLSQRQHEYDSTDPIQNSAMSMLLAGEGLGGSNHHLGDELLSEDGRTNISDIVTNPSEPPSPKRKFSTTTSHAHGLSNNSNTWNSDHNRNVPSSTSSTTKPKFNVNASEFKFDPSKTFSFKPQNAPTSSVPEAQGVPTRFGGFGAPGFNVSAAAFQPSISTTGTAGSLFEKGAAAFSAHAPAFTPSYAKKAVPEPASDPIFAEIVKPPTVKKVIPIVSPIIPQEVREDTPSMESMDRREDPAEGGRKRTKHSPRPSFQENFEEPQFETPEGDNEPELPMLYIDQEEQEENIVEPEQEINDSSDEGEKLIQTPLSEIDTGANGLGLEPFGANVVLPPDEVGDFEPLGAEVVSLPEEAEISEIQTEDQSPEPSQKFNFRPDAPAFGLRATAEEFNFEFPKPASPPKVFGGMSESRYAHTPSPPPTHPAPPPPVLNPGTSFLPPQESTDYDDDNAGPEKTNAFGEPMSMPMPTDAELDEVIRNLDHVDPTYIEQEGTEVDSIKDQEEEEDVSAEEQEPAVAEKLDLPWKRDSPKRMTIPNFEGPTPNKHLQGLRSAGPSPSPRRVAPFIRHRASSFSPDDDEPELPMHAISGSYNSQDIGIAKDDNSDWDDMISDDENKLRPQSRLFFDAHVEELVGGLFQRRLEPVLRALTSIDNNISSLSSVQQPKNMTDMVHSDADDEEDSDVIVQARSPRDRKLDKFKAAVAEVLLSQNGAGISQQSLEELIAVNKNLGSDIAELPSVLADTISSNSPKSEDMAIVRASLEDLASRVAESTEVTEIRTILGDGLATLVQSKDIRVAFSSTAQKTDITEIKTLIDEVIYRMARAEDFSEVKRALTSLNSNAVQHADLEEVTRTTRDVLKNGAKRQDVDNVMQVINESLTRKEDLVPIHRLLGDGFQNSAKTEDLKEMNQCLMGVKDSVLEIDVKSAHQDIIKISNDTVHISNTLQQLWALAEQHRDQIGFNLGRAQEMHQIGQDNALHISASLKEFRELWNSKATKSDMRRSLVEKEQKSDVNELKGLVSKALGNTMTIQEGLRELSRTQPTLVDFRSIVEISEVVQNIPSLESFKSIVEEAVSKAPGIDDFRKVIQEDRNQKSEQFDTAVQPTIQDIRSMMEDVIAKQQIFVPLNFDSKATDDELEALRKKVASLEASSAQCKKQAEEEAQSKREWQEKAIELETKLKIVQENADKDRADWQEKETGFQVQGEKDRQALVSSRMRCSLLAGTRASLQESQRELEIKISSLESSLEENRMKTISLETSLHESKESEERTSTLNKQLEDENRTLRRSIETLRAELEESIRVREGFRTKFDKVQDNIRRISSDIGQEQAKWKTTNDEQLCRIEVLEASVNAEATKNEFLESEVKRLEKEEKESIRLRVEIDSMERAAAKSDQLIAQLRQDALEDQTRAAHLARENAALKDVETERTLKKAAESANAALKDELHNKEREAKEAKRSHERSMRFAKEDHERSVKFAKENDSFLEQKLKNAESNADHLREMIASLTENFKIANSAAQAAAQAAATASQANGTNSDDRALRESVDVLQSQLQERETRIEQLESQLSSIDRPAVKQVQGQLNMYRDILEVRIDDLNEIIHMCKMPNADLAAIHDAATRLQASLEMQRQSGERTTGISNGGNSPTLSVASGARIGAAVWRGVGEKFAWRGGRTSGNTTPTPPATAQRFGGRFGRGSPQQTPIPRSSVSAAPPQFRYDADADAEGSVLSGGETETE